MFVSIEVYRGYASSEELSKINVVILPGTTVSTRTPRPSYIIYVLLKQPTHHLNNNITASRNPQSFYLSSFPFYQSTTGHKTIFFRLLGALRSCYLEMI